MRRGEKPQKSLRHVTIDVAEKLFVEFKKLQNTSGSYLPIAEEDKALQAVLRGRQIEDHMEIRACTTQPTLPFSPVDEKEKTIVHVPPRIFSQDHSGHVPLPSTHLQPTPTQESVGQEPRKRAPKHCSTCGQAKDLEPWRAYHMNE